MKVALLAGLCLACSVPASAAVVIVNPSFEDPDVGSEAVYDPDVDGMDFTPVPFTTPAGIAGNGSELGYSDAPDGTQIGFLQPLSGIAIDATGFTIGQTYRIILQAASRPGFDPEAGFLVRIEGDAGFFSHRFDVTSSDFTVFETDVFEANGTTGVLQVVSGFEPVGVDSISIVEAIMPQVPEPTTWAMLILGFGLIGTAARRASKVTVEARRMSAG